jgi:hypothetical protein
MMRFLLVLLPTLLLAPAVLAQGEPANAGTYREIVRHGVVIVTPGLDIDVTFAADGTFTALGGASTGVWRIYGDKLCSTPNETLIEDCAVYPAGKASGDTFHIDAPGTRLIIRIR